jgi:hypothetical protein
MAKTLHAIKPMKSKNLPNGGKSKGGGVLPGKSVGKIGGKKLPR